MELVAQMELVLQMQLEVKYGAKRRQRTLLALLASLVVQTSFARQRYGARKYRWSQCHRWSQHYRWSQMSSMELIEDRERYLHYSLRSQCKRASLVRDMELGIIDGASAIDGASTIDEARCQVWSQQKMQNAIEVPRPASLASCSETLLNKLP